jgi:hypothetical protein
MMPNEDVLNSILQPIIGPWYESLENPQKAQEQVLGELLKKYAKRTTEKATGALQIAGIADYQKSFPCNRLQGAAALLCAGERGQLQRNFS